MRLEPATRKIGILLSGRGSNLRAIAENIDSGVLDAEIGLVLGNRADAPGLEEARRRGLETICLQSKGQSREAYTGSVLGALSGRGISLICLAGFMRILGADFVSAFPWGILNIHPSLLPAFPGLDVQRQALEHGVRFSGCTVHFVDESLDGGPIVAQAVVPVRGDDTVETLAERILREEHRIYSEAIAAVLDGRCEVRGRRVIVHEG